MNFLKYIKRFLLLAEKYLNKNKIEESLDICDEIEFIMKDIQEKSSLNKEEMKVLQRVCFIRRKLNSIMVNEFRQTRLQV